MSAPALLAEGQVGAERIALFALVAVVGIALAGLLAGLETGMYSLSRVRLSIRAARGDRRSARLAAEYARPRRMLAALLVANAIAGWVASFGVSQIFDGLGYGPVKSVLLDLLVLVPVVFLFGEVLPKDLFRIHADRWMPRFAGFLVAVRLLLTMTALLPVVGAIGAFATWIFGGRGRSEVVEERARVWAMLAEGAGTGGLSDAQLGFADRVFTMRGISIGQEMKPWRQVATIRLEAAPAERARAFLQSGASRLPVIDRAGRVVGVVSATDHLSTPEASTEALARPALVLRAETPALEAIGAMRRDRARLAIVAEAPERPLGIVTMKDLVEPLVGDLAVW